jgi:hypothetical protein
MTEPKEPDKCAKCTKPLAKQDPTLCALCDDVKYCSAQCKTDDL